MSERTAWGGMTNLASDTAESVVTAPFRLFTSAAEPIVSPVASFLLKLVALFGATLVIIKIA